jgi:peroxiredoxin Q/BCP
MSTITVGKAVPNFSLPATGGKTVDLKGLRGSNVVIYFYPKDNTPGCTTESCDFGSLHSKFRQKKTVILGVSRDSLGSHEKFRAKFEFPFDLLSDGDESLCRLFDVIREKNMYGKKVMGVVRSTFLIDAAGKLRAEWRKVSVKGHAAEVLAAVEAL